MNRFVQNLNKLLYTRYTEEQKAEHDTKQEVYVKKRMWPVERHAMEIYTSKVYEMFRDEIDKCHSYDVFPNSSSTVFMVKHTNAEYVQRYKRAEFEVKRINNGEKYTCDCGMYEHFGMLCCHVLRVFIQIGVREIPAFHIMLRWTRHARDIIPMNLRVNCCSTTVENMKLMQNSLLYGKALRVCSKGNLDFETYEIVMKYLQLAENEVDKLIETRQMQADEALAKAKVSGVSEYVSSSDVESVPANVYGASGSSAGMSDEDQSTSSACGSGKTNYKAETCIAGQNQDEEEQEDQGHYKWCNN